MPFDRIMHIHRHTICTKNLHFIYLDVCNCGKFMRKTLAITYLVENKHMNKKNISRIVRTKAVQEDTKLTKSNSFPIFSMQLWWKNNQAINFVLVSLFSLLPRIDLFTITNSVLLCFFYKYISGCWTLALALWE